VELAELIVQAKQEGEGKAAIYDVVIDGAPQKRIRREKTKRVADHFSSVVRLAERTAPAVHPRMIQNARFIIFYRAGLQHTSRLFG
jgi:hypothetical protein